jgi:hypothetical protein
MGIHGSDLVHTITEALVRDDLTPTMSEPRYEGDGTTGWPNRDGKIWFECVGRDWFRGFRVTVEVKEVDDMEWDLQTGEWDAPE